MRRKRFPPELVGLLELYIRKARRLSAPSSTFGIALSGVFSVALRQPRRTLVPESPLGPGLSSGPERLKSPLRPGLLKLALCRNRGWAGNRWGTVLALCLARGNPFLGAGPPRR